MLRALTNDAAIAGRDQVIDIESNKDHVLVITLDVNAVIGLALFKIRFQHEVIYCFVPHARRMLKPVQRSLKLANVIWMIFIDESVRLRHVNILLKLSVEKRCLYIHMVNCEIVLGGQTQQNSDRRELGYWCDFIMVDADF